MDDILISHACSKQLQKTFGSTQKALQVGGLVIAPEKNTNYYCFSIFRSYSQATHNSSSKIFHMRRPIKNPK
jgi:hypothetical protein